MTIQKPLKEYEIRITWLENGMSFIVPQYFIPDNCPNIGDEIIINGKRMKIISIEKTETDTYHLEFMLEAL